MASRESAVGREHEVAPLRMAEQRETLEGSLDARSLARLDDVLAPGDDAVDVHWQITGARSVDGRPVLVVSLEGALPLVCQRCLEPFSWPLEQQTRVVLAHNDAELAALDEALDDEVILGSKKVGAEALVADELLLSIPFAPAHADACP